MDQSSRPWTLHCISVQHLDFAAEWCLKFEVTAGTAIVVKELVFESKGNVPSINTPKYVVISGEMYPLNTTRYRQYITYMTDRTSQVYKLVLTTPQNTSGKQICDSQIVEITVITVVDYSSAVHS